MMQHPKQPSLGKVPSLRKMMPLMSDEPARCKTDPFIPGLLVAYMECDLFVFRGLALKGLQITRVRAGQLIYVGVLWACRDIGALWVQSFHQSVGPAFSGPWQESCCCCRCEPLPCLKNRFLGYHSCPYSLRLHM